MDPFDGRVVSNFIVQALQNKPITIYGDGTQTRSFCYVDDNVRGMMNLMDSNDDIIGPINIGNPVEFTMLQLASLVTKMTNSKSPIVKMPLPQDDPKQRKPNIELATTLLDWQPSVKLENGLIKTIEYFKTVI
jgi:UDP-glucuronate decarboxylase